MCFTLEASSYFALADGNASLSAALMKAAGVFGFLAGLLGFYATAHYLCEDVLPFCIPMGDTSRVIQRWKKAKNMA
jgi:succinate-acetate transporter protein